MKTLFMIIWLFPILFMIHDFEEIIMIEAWQERNKQYIENMANKHIPFNFKASTASFSIAVAEEFIILSIVTVVSCLLDNYIVWYGLFIAFTLHLLFHIFQWLSFKKYLPSVITSISFLPLCCFLIYKINILLDYDIITLLFSISISILVMVGNIYILHKAMMKFDSWLEKYIIKSL
ncbi:HXXEE domain-containing protein [Clostridium sp. DJ247]|uniref:HXXEE domain-containing protein n=1 Tax=Clostridium sp. DJ247 TaxID=2726188 RepID=UPI00162354B3|nr:HXXEE domain-containing protein [Clostridium sp. DJ247]MBC2582383.1 HXXEE domain-containing protein [Clostridium sp. DJ247]